jgi:hypothetical protein
MTEQRLRNALALAQEAGDPGSEEEIAKLEEFLGFALPEELRMFYRCANGCGAGARGRQKRILFSAAD